MALPQKVLLSFAALIIFGSSVLALPAHVVTLRGRPVVAPIPEPLPLPCRRQNWTNADRICLAWPAPRAKRVRPPPSQPTEIEAASPQLVKREARYSEYHTRRYRLILNRREKH